MEDPRVGLVGQADVVLGQQTRQARGQRGPVHPALARAALIHRRHENKIARNQLQLVLVLRLVGVHHPQRLQGHGQRSAESQPFRPDDSCGYKKKKVANERATFF